VGKLLGTWGIIAIRSNCTLSRLKMLLNAISSCALFARNVPLDALQSPTQGLTKFQMPSPVSPLQLAALSRRLDYSARARKDRQKADVTTNPRLTTVGEELPSMNDTHHIFQNFLASGSNSYTGNEKLRYRVPIPTWILLCGRYRLMFTIPPTHCAQ
jgi:hypothetical protein